MTTASYSSSHGDDDAEELFRQYARSRDTRIRERLVAMHQNLVRFLAGKFANRGEPLEDLVQVGTIGLINAVDRYDAGRGTKFSTYATPTIVGEIRRYFRDKAWSLKVPRRLQELNQAANKAVDVLSVKLGRSPTVAEIAEVIGASEEETLEAMELGNAYDTVSLDSRMSTESESAPMPSSGSKWKTTRCSQYSVSVQNTQPAKANSRVASTPLPPRSTTNRAVTAGPNRAGGTAGCTRDSRSRVSDLNIRGEALSVSVRFIPMKGLPVHRTLQTTAAWR